MWHLLRPLHAAASSIQVQLLAQAARSFIVLHNTTFYTTLQYYLRHLRNMRT